MFGGDTSRSREALGAVRADVAKNPASFKLHTQLARLLFELDPAQGNIDGVIAEAEEGLLPLESLPAARNVPEPYRMAGGYCLVKGELQRAPRAYEKAIEILLRCVAIEKSVRASYDEKLEAWRARGHQDVPVPLPDDSESYQLLAATYLVCGPAPVSAGSKRRARL